MTGRGSDQIACRIKPYIQPFERRLALTELAALACSPPAPIGPSSETVEFQVRSSIPPTRLAAQLAYWEQVRTPERTLATTQSLREATVNIVRNGIPWPELFGLLPFRGEVPTPNRRCLRYGPHGIHQYRGKFFPQLVRALLNIAKVPTRGLVADPMCGSGTTLLEGILSGRTAIGMDLNPLSVLMSRTKCALLSVDPRDLLESYESVRKALLRPRPSRQTTLPYFASLPPHDQQYLLRWFSRQVLADLDQIATIVAGIEQPAVRDLMRLALSNILRRVSWQKDDDLRVRKEVLLDAEIDPIREFLEELGRSVRLVLGFVLQNGRASLGPYDVSEGDARVVHRAWKRWRGKVDVVVTSPPYATALPYLDTDRLSLIYLRLLTRREHRRRDQEMIGNREITDSNRNAYLDCFRSNKAELPDSVVALVERIARLNRGANVGFRRRNLPALLAKYFLDIRQVLGGIWELLKPGAFAYVVVGDNHTIAGGKRVEIRTSNLVLDTARSVGFDIMESTPMEMLVSRDIFRRNAVASEVILAVRKP